MKGANMIRVISRAQLLVGLALLMIAAALAAPARNVLGDEARAQAPPVRSLVSLTRYGTADPFYENPLVREMLVRLGGSVAPGEAHIAH
jgi:hypothetical protein